MKNKFIKYGIFLLLVVVIIILITKNVTTKKESNIESLSHNTINLDIDSEIVSGLYQEVILFDDVFDDETYKYLYFNFENDKKILSADEKLYIVFNSLYKNNELQIEEIDVNEQKINISKDAVNLEYERLFKESIDGVNIYYKTSENCGIIGYESNDEGYLLDFKKCNNTHESIDINRLENALKDGNFISLELKAFKAVYNTKYSKEESSMYDIINYDSNVSLKLVDEDTVVNLKDEIFTIDGIYSYIFLFELKGDNYYLSEIQKKR